MSVISALVAVIMLSTTVFASGILTDLTTDDYTIDILNNGEKIELANKPFIENCEVYVPLRETLEKAMSKDKGIVDIQWDNGTIDVIVAYYQGTSGKYQLKIGGGFVKLQHISYEDYKNNSVENSMIVTALSLKQPPVLKDTITYVTLKDVNYMLYSYTSRRDENNNLYKLDYIVYDKNGKSLSASFVYPIDDKTALATIPNYEDKQQKCSDITERFFEAFSKGDMENMKQYCTNDFIKDYFRNDSFLSMRSGTLKTIYSIRAFSNGDYYVHLKMSSDDLADKERIYYAVFEEQPNSEFLMKSFQESYSDEWELTR